MERLDDPRAQQGVLRPEQQLVGGEERPQEVPEAHVGRGEEVERCDDRVQRVGRESRQLGREAAHEIGVEPRGTRTCAREPDEVSRLLAIGLEHPLDDGRRHPGRAVVWLRLRRIASQVGRVGEVADRPSRLHRCAELLAEREEHDASGLRRAQIDAVLADRPFDDRSLAAAHEHRDEVGDGLDDGAALAAPVIVDPELGEHRMRGLMRHDVVREARVDGLPGKVVAGHGRVRGELTEHQGERLGVEPRVLVRHRVGHQLEAPSRAPHERTAEAALGDLEHLHRHGVEHLLVELRVALRGRETLVEQHVGRVEVDGREDGALGRVEVDHLDEPADRTGLERLVQQAQDDRLAKAIDHRVVGEDPKRAARRVASDKRDLRPYRASPPRSMRSPRGRSSAGRAPALQAGGRGFESHRLHWCQRIPSSGRCWPACPATRSVSGSRPSSGCASSCRSHVP